MNRVYRGWVFNYKGTQEDNQVIYTATRYTVDGIHKVIEGTYMDLIREIDGMNEKEGYSI